MLPRPFGLVARLVRVGVALAAVVVTKLDASTPEVSLDSVARRGRDVIEQRCDVVGAHRVERTAAHTDYDRRIYASLGEHRNRHAAAAMFVRRIDQCAFIGDGPVYHIDDGE